ncbi:MAG: hypothetical protein HQL28_02980, partial [Candidatus Omnitrophica bacterium]|nr:hypothetical protein [Candidatus Omnitrophota bacterium]
MEVVKTLFLQTAAGSLVCGSICLFFYKFFFYLFGNRAKKYINNDKSDRFFVIRKSLTIAFTGTVLFSALLGWPLVQQLTPMLYMPVKVLSGFLFSKSIFELVVDAFARKRFKGIVVEQMLYEGGNENEINRSTNKFIETNIERFTVDQLKMISRVSRAYETAIKTLTPDKAWPTVPARERMQYEKLFGRGARPMGSLYDFSGIHNYSDASKVVGGSFTNISDEDLLKKMSGKGYNDLLDHLKINKEKEELRVCDAQADPKKFFAKHRLEFLAANGNIADPDLYKKVLMNFLHRSENANELRIVAMFDLMPKCQNWVVVVNGDELQVTGLVQELSNFRYPFQRLKIVVAGEGWDHDTTTMIQGLQARNLVPSEEFCRICPAPARENKQPYTKPGANTFALMPDATDGAFGLIFDAEDIPDNLMMLKFMTGVVEGTKEVSRMGRHLADWIKDVEKGNGWQIGPDIDKTVEHYKEVVEKACDRYMESLTQEDQVSNYRFNIKRGSLLKRNLRNFVTDTLPVLLEFAQGNAADNVFLSPAMLKLKIKQLNQFSGNKQARKLLEKYLDVYKVIANMPGYGEAATKYLQNRDLDEFVKALIGAEFLRINYPKNGQGRLSQDRNALAH